MGRAIGRSRGQAWRWRPNAHPEAGGFALLLALFGGLVLLLSSLSVQTTALQSRASDHRLVLRRHQEDALFSAAQLVAQRLQRHRCLLTLPLAQWAGPAAAACSTPTERLALQAGELPGADGASGRFLLVNYTLPDPPEPLAPGGDLELEWRPAAGGAVRRRIRLALLAASDPQAPPLLRGLRP